MDVFGRVAIVSFVPPVLRKRTMQGEGRDGAGQSFCFLFGREQSRRTPPVVISSKRGVTDGGPSEKNH